jgi:predicted ATPase/transcriptional regulator with XRE-family HTH domain
MTAKQTGSGPGLAGLLRTLRRAAGLTQADLAGMAGIAVRTVREVERGRTLRVHRATAVLLADALGLTGEDRAAFLAAARIPAQRRVPQAGPGRDGLPAPPPDQGLIGRGAEVARLAAVVATLTGPAAPLSLVGVAGVGKSALAHTVRHRVADDFPGGTALVTVEVGWSAAEVAAAIAVALGTSGSGPGTGAPALLLVDATDRAPTGVRAALVGLPPSVRVIAVGRGPLGLTQERVWPVTPLAVPPAGEADLAEMARYPAAELFLERLARARTAHAGAGPGTPPAGANPAHLLADAEAPALSGLVRRLGGLPLALEQAAAHGNVLRLPEILERYGDRVLELGSPAGALRKAMAASYRLLAPPEQAALRRLTAFRASWSVELAEQLLAGQPGGLGIEDPVPLLDRLVSLGLVEVRGVRENRFRLLEVVRDFAAEQAERTGELVLARRVHAVVVAQLAGRTAGALAGARLPAAMARLDDLAADVWAALYHAANDDPDTALRLASALPRWWRFHGQDRAGRQWLRRLLDDPRAAGTGGVVRAWGQLGLAQLALEHGQGAAERPAAETALAAFRRAGDIAGELAARTTLAAVSRSECRYDDARAHTEAALVAATRSGRSREAMEAQQHLIWHEVRVGDLAAARRRLVAVDRSAAQAGEQRVRVLAAVNLAEVARLEGRYEEAITVGGRVLARLHELGDPGDRRRVLGTLGQAFAALSRLPEAERALATLRAEIGPGGRVPTADGLCTLIEARLALARDDRDAAAERFAAAVAELTGGQDPRTVVESLVGLAVCTSELEPRRRVLDRLSEVTRCGGFALLPREQDMLGTARC